MADITVKCPHCDTQLKIDEVYFRPPFNDPKNAGRIIIDFEHPGHGIKIPESGEKKALPKANEGEALTLTAKPVLKAFIPRMAGALILSMIGMFIISKFGLEPVIPRHYAVWVICGLTLLNIIYDRFSSEYRLSTQRLFIKKGFFSLDFDELELFRIKDVKYTQSAPQRLFGVGNVIIYSTDDSTPEIVMQHIPKPFEVKEKIRVISKQSRKDEKVLTAEFIQS